MTDTTPPPLSLDDLKHLFDLATDSPLACSGSFDSDDVGLLRKVAALIGVDPNSPDVTPDEFAANYPHPHKRRPVVAEMLQVGEWVGPDGQVITHEERLANAGDGRYHYRPRSETGGEAQARIAEERADGTCQVGPYGRRCGRLADDPIHTPTTGDTDHG
jgi:hypothetical protein